MKLLLAICFGAVGFVSTLPAANPRMIFTKTFPGSEPAYVEISLQPDGTASYKEAPDDAQPVLFQMTQPDCVAMFDLAAKLDHFTRPLEANLKVAFMGKKTFRYDDGTPHQVEFNYSADPNALALLDWFERIAESERGYVELERAVKYDKLGVQDALLHVETTRDQKRLIAPQQFLPLLDRVVKNESYMHMARERAASFADGIRAASVSPAAQR